MSSPSQLRILIVDDEAPARRKILRLLGEESAVEIAGEADNGEAAIVAIKQHRPDLLFLDVQMPGLDGFGVIRSLNAAKIPFASHLRHGTRSVCASRLRGSRFRLSAQARQRRALSRSSLPGQSPLRASGGRIHFSPGGHAGAVAARKIPARSPAHPGRFTGHLCSGHGHLLDRSRSKLRVAALWQENAQGAVPLTRCKTPWIGSCSCASTGER